MCINASHQSSSHGVKQCSNVMPRDGSPFLSQCNLQLQYCSWWVVPVSDLAPKTVPKVLDGRHVWGLAGPLHDINVVGLQILCADSSSVWGGAIMLEFINSRVICHEGPHMLVQNVISVFDGIEIVANNDKVCSVGCSNPTPNHH